MRILYFTNQYPAATHTFIRREILALERSGTQIQRCALRSNAAEMINPDDQQEVAKTHYILGQNALSIAWDALRTFIGSPIKFMKTLSKVLKFGWTDDRSGFYHLAYFVEACALARYAAKTRAEHLHVHFGTNPATVAMYCRLLGGPTYSFTVHGPDEFDRPGALRLAEKILYADFVVAISAYTKSQLMRWCRSQDQEKIKIVRCGLEPSFLDADAPPPTAVPKLVSVGRLAKQKGQMTLIQAVAQLVDEIPDFEIILVGDGPLHDELQQSISRLGLDQHIRITGWLSGDHVREEIAKARGLVLSSFAEGLPVVLMESFALSRTVISTNVAGCAELVINAENGWLIPPGSPEDLADAMRDLLATDTTRLQEMAEEGRKRVRQRHNIDIEAKKLAELFVKHLH